MKIKMFAFAISLFSCMLDNTYAQVEKGDARLGGAFQLEAFEDETNIDLEFGSGRLLSNNFEIGILLAVIRKVNTYYYGKVGGNAIYHFQPKKKMVSGIGLSVSRTLGYPKKFTVDNNSWIFYLFYNADAFISASCALNLRAGYERWKGGWGHAGGFVTRIGIAYFWKQGR